MELVTICWYYKPVTQNNFLHYFRNVQEVNSSWEGRADHQSVLSPKLLIGRTKCNAFVRFQVLTAASMKMAVFWVVAPCSLVDVYQRFRGPCCLHHQGMALTRLHGATTQKITIFCHTFIHSMYNFDFRLWAASNVE
jgi:hypothetical protein